MTDQLWSITSFKQHGNYIFVIEVLHSILQFSLLNYSICQSYQTNHLYWNDNNRIIHIQK